MHDLIRRLVTWLSHLLIPGTGTHRAGVHPMAVPAHVERSSISHPTHRSPYGLDLPLDSAEGHLVRPYLVAHEQELDRRRCRRLALVVAADFGIDLDRHLIGTTGVAA
jgi:hypothetical protein